MLTLQRDGLQLVVPAETNSGVLFLFQAADLDQLSSAPTLMLLTNAPVTNSLQISLTPQQRAFFYAIRRTNSSLEEYQVPEIPDEPSAPYALWILGIPTNLVSGVSYTADFLLVLSTNALADVSGTAQLSVMRQVDGLAHPDAQVTPEQIIFVHGACRTNVQVTASTSLTGYVVAVTLTGASAALPSLAKAKAGPAAASSTSTLVPGILLPNSPPSAADAFTTAQAGVLPLVDTAGWSSPIATTPPAVSGTFGEWRGNSRKNSQGGWVDNANYHEGLDLVAPAGATVWAARGGIVRANQGSSVGRIVTVDHLDGWYSRYVHLSPADEPKVGSHVNRGDSVGVVATSAQNGGLSPHIHFELRAASTGRWEVKPGIALDPLRQPVGPAGMFAVAPPQNLSSLGRVGVTPKNPAAQIYYYKPPVEFVAGNDSTAYVVLKIKQPQNGNYLSPQTVRFTPEGQGSFVELSTPNTPAIESLLPDGTPPVEGGFARYKHGTWHDAGEREEYFRYWFRWDVSGYSAAAIGPRTFTVDSANYAGTLNPKTLKWGPEILSVVKVSESGGEQRFRVSVRAWLGEDAATAASDVSKGAWDTGADWYRYELPAGGRWVANNTANYDETDSSSALVKLREQEFWWAGTPDSTDAQVTVRSRTVPAIADKKPVNNMALIPAGNFTMGDTFGGEGGSYEVPTHTVFVSAFYMDRTEVTKALWDDVYNWATNHGYSFNAGSFGLGKASTHPVQTVNWHDAVKWCNARSEKEGRTPAYYTNAAQTAVYRSGQVSVDNTWVNWSSGYRLPTEAEWEKAARGGASGHRFPWADADTITHSLANYYSSSSYAYDVSPTRNYHPSFQAGGTTYTSPAGYFAANGYGLYDMAGNVREWCWDWYSSTYYSTSSGTDPRGPTAGSLRVARGGGWHFNALNCRTAGRNYDTPTYRDGNLGFRSVLPPGQP